MIHEYLLLSVALLLAVLLLVMVGQRLKISYPIFLVIAGAVMGMIPGVPHIRIEPDVVFLIFLPPILFEAAWYTSWVDFWKWKRPIILLAVGLVILSSTVVAYFAEAFLPGYTLAMGFLLGGIISPPDAIAATSVLKHIRIPRRLVTILEGESLINDASSLIVFKFALAAMITGQFVLRDAVGSFFLLVGMGVLIGILIGVAIYAVHIFLPTTSGIDTVLTLLTPYLLYTTAEYLNYSGVMAVVSGGLFLSYHSHQTLTYQSRLQTAGVWDTLIFLINGVVFMLIGLELRVILDELEDITVLQAAVKHGLIISGLLILVRLAWTYIIAYFPRWIQRWLRHPEPSWGWKSPLIIGVSGMRGVVSLAAAFSIPLLLPGGAEFPQRDNFLLITFVVIAVTLVGQGLILPLLIELLHMDEIDHSVPVSEQEASIELKLKLASLEVLRLKYSHLVPSNELVTNLRKQLENDISLVKQKLNSLEYETDKYEMKDYQEVMSDLLQKQRDVLAELRDDHTYVDEVLRNYASQLDLEEARLKGGG